MKRCRTCENLKELNDFSLSNRTKDGRDYICKICDRARNKKYRDKIGKDGIRNMWLGYKYGITLEQYTEMWNKQEGRCAICKIHAFEYKKNLSVDHDHQSNKIRGLLCSKCNHAIGLLNEDIETSKNATRYLEFHKLNKLRVVK